MGLLTVENYCKCDYIGVNVLSFVLCIIRSSQNIALLHIFVSIGQQVFATLVVVTKLQVNKSSKIMVAVNLGL